MPALMKQTEEFRKLQAMEAIRLMGQGVKKAQACEQAGLSIRQYDLWLARDDGAIKVLQNVIIESERVRMAELVSAQAILLRELIENVTQPGTPVLVLLKALKYLDKLAEALQEKHGVHTETDPAETYLKLNGPVTRVEPSMMA